MKVLQIVLFAVLGVSASVVNAATIFTANNQDVDFIVPAGFVFDIAVFANAADLASGTNATNVTLDNTIPASLLSPALLSGQLALGSGNSFVVGVSGDSGVSWIEDIGFSGGTTGILSFVSNQVGVLLVDVQVVPVPAAAWLFGSGLIGLVAVSRRKGLREGRA